MTVDLFWGKRVSLRIGTLLVNHVSVEAQLQSLYWQHKLNPLNYNIYIFLKKNVEKDGVGEYVQNMHMLYTYMKVSKNYINTFSSQCWDYRIEPVQIFCLLPQST